VQSRIEPPILISRLLTLVFAATVVALVAMVFTLTKLFPLNRPQVFFLWTQPHETIEVKLAEMPPVDENLDRYKRAFIREYIKARNEIVPNIADMRKKWTNDGNALVRAWSSDEVFNKFAQTGLWTALMNEIPDFEFACPVEFETGAIVPRSGDNTYAVNFRYFCVNNNGQIAPKDYTIILKLDMGEGATMKWTDRLNNPLGIRVSEYTVESVDGNANDKTDPLDRFQ
jgi:type IV secretory pathway component VirB8